MTLADAPNWAEQVSAWSAAVAAGLTLVAAVSGVIALVVSVKALKNQNKVFKGQIEQLQRDQQEREEQRQRQQLNRARQVTIEAGVIEPYGDELDQLVDLVNQSEEGRGDGTYPAAYVLVQNGSETPITSVESIFGDTFARYCWVEGRDRLEGGAVLHYLPAGRRAFFVHTGVLEANVPHFRCELSFTDDDGQRWKSDEAGKTRRIDT